MSCEEQACGILVRDIPLITKVSVSETSFFEGEIEINWVKPKLPDLDTLLASLLQSHLLPVPQNHTGSIVASVWPTLLTYPRLDSPVSSQMAFLVYRDVLYP